MRTRDDLRMMQAAPLSVKVRLTEDRIRQWVYEFGEDGVYISFSGGKDSTVLCDIIDKLYPDNQIPKVFVNTGLEYPQIVQFVKTKSNVVIIRPKKNFKQIITEYGYPFISKEISEKIHESISKPNGYAAKSFIPEDMGGRPGQYNYSKWSFMLSSPYKFSGSCCRVMKKSPAKNYEHETGRKPITAQMAQESRLRTQQWIKHGCNAFDKIRCISNPMSFWTEQDVLHYIKENNIEICSVYGDIVEDNEELEGQMSIADYGIDSFEDKKLKTTGCSRTGCVFCGYGCHLEKPGEGRFERMKETHPKLYDYVMRPTSEGGLGYKEVIDWINNNGNLNIKY